MTPVQGARRSCRPGCGTRDRARRRARRARGRASTRARACTTRRGAASRRHRRRPRSGRAPCSSRRAKARIRYSARSPRVRRVEWATPALPRAPRRSQAASAGVPAAAVASRSHRHRAKISERAPDRPLGAEAPTARAVPSVPDRADAVGPEHDPSAVPRDPERAAGLAAAVHRLPRRARPWPLVRRLAAAGRAVAPGRSSASTAARRAASGLVAVMVRTVVRPLSVQWTS